MSENKSKWFIGHCNPNKEKRCHEAFDKLNITNFLPIQKEEHRWSQGRKKIVDRLIIPGYIFVRCTEEERRDIFKDSDKKASIQPYMSRWMVDKAITTESGYHAIASVPDKQMQSFMDMVRKANRPIEFDPSRFRRGDQIRVIHGNMEGCTGELEVLPNKSMKLVIRIQSLGFAKVEVDIKDIEIIK